MGGMLGQDVVTDTSIPAWERVYRKPATNLTICSRWPLRRPNAWDAFATKVQNAVDDPAVAKPTFDVGPRGTIRVEQAIDMLLTGDVLVHTPMCKHASPPSRDVSRDRALRRFSDLRPNGFGYWAAVMTPMRWPSGSANLPISTPGHSGSGPSMRRPPSDSACCSAVSTSGTST